LTEDSISDKNLQRYKIDLQRCNMQSYRKDMLKRAKKSFPTLNDVAAYAGVSPKTVSNVVNNNQNVAEPTRIKVREAITAVGYRPSALARSLVTGQTKTIGVMIPDVSNPFFGQSILGCEKILNASGYSVVLCDTEEDFDKERRYLATLMEKGADGLILWGGQMGSEELVGLTSGRVPMIAVDTAIEELAENTTIVRVENERGARAAVRHLLQAGRKRIGHISGPLQRATARRRSSGYQSALGEAGIAFDPCLLVETAPSIRAGYRAALRLLESRQLDAVFCYNDLIAIGAVVACNHLGISIPDDLALVGFDDITIAALITPSLTTVRIAQYELGKLAATLLLERLESRDVAGSSVDFPVSLQIRNSCGTKNLSHDDMRTILDTIASSEAVDLPVDFPAECKEHVT
jgi:LacI family transcriptional regulator